MSSNRPKIIVPIAAQDSAAFSAAVKNLRPYVNGKKIDLIEWRADYYVPLPAKKPVPAPAPAAEAPAQDSAAPAEGAENAAEVKAEVEEPVVEEAPLRKEVTQATLAEFLHQCMHALDIFRMYLPDIPLLFTFRTAHEGGDAEISLATYCALNKAIAESGRVNMIDVEVFSFAKKAAPSEVIIPAEIETLMKDIHAANVEIVGSHHDFAKTDSKDVLVEYLEKISTTDADILKLAVMPKTEEDVQSLMDAAAEAHEKFPDRPIISISMGGLGQITRTDGERYGNYGTFAMVGQGSAPGQIPCDELMDILDAVHEELIGQKKNNITLIGFMGTGKSTVGVLLSEALSKDLVDTDALIEDETGERIRDTFANKGEKFFRDLETKTIISLEDYTDSIFAAGGGSILRSENVDSMRKHSTIVLLTASPDTVLLRLHGDITRPVLEGRKTVEEIGQMMEIRRPFYEGAADITVVTDEKTPEEVCAEILRALS